MNRNRNTPRHQTGTPPEHAGWRGYTFVQVFIPNLPDGVRTVDVHRNLKKHGNIVQIDLHEKRDGQTSRNAEVVFKPPPSLELWQPGNGQMFTLKDGATTWITFKLSNRQRKNFTVGSPIHPGISYNEEIILQAQSIDFGILRSEHEMFIMKSAAIMTQKRDVGTITIATQLILNLKQMQIELRFPVYLCSANGDRIREYRFFIALDDKFSIWRMHNADGGVSYALHVLNPPWYSRKLEQRTANSHVNDSKRWREDDMWSRQTDIVHAKEDFALIDQTPISIRKNSNTINLARWTTFKINIAVEDPSAGELHYLENALKDFNVQVVEMAEFKAERVPTPFEPPYWSLMPVTYQPNGQLQESKYHLPFSLRYQLDVCISQGWLSEYDVDEPFLAKLQQMPEHKARQMLIHLDAFEERVYDPMTIFTNIKLQKPVKARRLPPNCVEIHHAIVTATGIKLFTPTVEQSNRVIRRYRTSSSHFLRVRFEDDEYRGLSKLFASSNNKMILVFDRVRRTMKHGIVIAGRRYEFLAWGNSQLREHGAYFFAPDEKERTASSIRAEMGAFDNERIVAKRAARMGQCFSTTSPIPVRIPTVNVENTIPDVVRGKYTFTDGVGKISPLLAGLVQSCLKIQGPVPSCFQFRLGGCKGVLVVDPHLKGIDLKVRKSQFKFDSTSRELEIIRWSEFWQPYLNRQLILVLSNLGVPDRVFKNMQEATIKALDAAMQDDNAALKALRDNVDPNTMTLTICGLVANGFRRVKEPFVMSILNLWRAWSLKYLKEKAKIPVSKGCFVLGVVDETAILRGHFDSLKLPQQSTREEKEQALPEIFIQITNPQTGKPEVIEGICILARNPSLHKGDIRVVKAVNVSELHHLVDVVVMPQTGDRDLPSMCSGGDLDGDDYIVLWDEALIPPVWNAEPFHYNAPEPVTADGEITTEHIIGFFYDYLQNDYLGRIAHAHLAGADFYDDGIENEQCLELVQLHSIAVDYPKTGVPARLPRGLERNEWPHFMEKRGRSYRSHKVLGQLYDAVKRVDFKAKMNVSFDARILNWVNPPSKTQADAANLKYEYDIAMQQIMAQHKIKTEFEVWSTFVMHHSKASSDFKFHEEIGMISKTLKEKFYQSIVDICGGDTFQHLCHFAVAAYQHTAEQFTAAIEGLDLTSGEEEPLKMPFISFPWLLADVLGKVATATPATQEVQLDDSKEVYVEIDRITTSTRSKFHATNEILDEHDMGENDGVEAELAAEDLDPAEIVKIEAPRIAKNKKTSTPASHLKDPFIILDPFSGMKKTMAPAPKHKAKKSTVAKQVDRPRSSSGEHSDGSSYVLVSGAPSELNSPVESIKSIGQEPNLGDDEPIETAKTGPEVEVTSGYIDEAGQHIRGSVCAFAGDSCGNLALQSSGIILSDGKMKDPALMTAEEMAALGLGDDDDL